jgi:hypothetical protein
MQIIVTCDVMPCSLMDRYHHFSVWTDASHQLLMTGTETVSKTLGTEFIFMWLVFQKNLYCMLTLLINSIFHVHVLF